MVYNRKRWLVKAFRFYHLAHRYYILDIMDKTILNSTLTWKCEVDFMEEIKSYVICTDSSSDIPLELLREWGVVSTPLSFKFNASDKQYFNDEINIQDFYAQMKEGAVAKTSAVNSEQFIESFKPILEAGHDILYLGFSSGLSTTYNSARIAKEALVTEYPDRRIEIVDTLCASAGEALLIRLVLDKKENGATLDEAAEYAEGIKLSICHWFTVDDLVYLKRGGRVSSTTAFVGNMLGIKPVMHVDNDGHLVNVAKVRGRKTSIATLAEKYSELCADKNARVFISHGDCRKDAEELARIIEEKNGKKTDLITDVGPVIGAHSGPGTLALFFVGKER